ncbi:Protein of unknown function [Cotesia congregata]|uniref:Uncharacterized protein n=1 Tax=Cotesia congregata TaxID=51543 RepID=A0A8J2E839_COTCN|nr:Protein of unknown function [Cotesia congregata]
MTFRWIQVIQLMVVSSVCAFETSEEYLRKAMHELQGIQSPLYTNYPFFAGKRYSRTANILQVQQDTRPGYPPKKSEPEVSQYYSQALQSGNAINLPGLKNSLESGQIPTVVGNHLHIPDSSQQQQQFAYYFYPLKSFMDTLQIQESQKQIIINPLFMAISSFVGMALVFMFGVIVLPRILGEFRSRVVHDELLDLTTTVNAAIDKYELTTTRPKTPFGVAMVGIKTRPVQRVKRKKIQRNRTVI